MSVQAIIDRELNDDRVLIIAIAKVDGLEYCQAMGLRMDEFNRERRKHAADVVMHGLRMQLLPRSESDEQIDVDRLTRKLLAEAGVSEN